MQGGDDQFFVGLNRLPEFAQLFYPEINVFCFAGIEKLFMFINDFHHGCAV
jgi:hypothetical protein